MNDLVTVARNDFTNVRRSRLLWGVVAVYVAFVALLFVPFRGGEEIDIPLTLLGAAWLTALLLPLIAIVGSYLAIAGERESNTIRFLLSQPTSRRDVVLGKFLSRGATVLLGVLIATVVGIGMVVALYPEPELGAMVTFFVLSALLAAAYVSVSIGISAVVTTRSRAITAMIGFYFVTVLLSVVAGSFIEAIPRMVFGGVLGLDAADELSQFVVALLSPAAAYMDALAGTFPADASEMIPATSAFYLEPWFLTGVLLLWIVVPLAAGSVVFDGAEIG